MKPGRWAYLLLALAGAGALWLALAVDLAWFESLNTYGNFDAESDQAFVMYLWPGGADMASTLTYHFDQGLHLVPIVALTAIFVIFYVLRTVGSLDVKLGISRGLTAWAAFVVARFGLIRVSGAAPVKRCSYGLFPFLNCQACEMASGGCPIGSFQASLVQMRFPLLPLVVLLITGLAMGRWICGWLCPFGLLSDIFDRVSKHRVRPRKAWISLKYVMLGLIVVVPLTMGFLGGATWLPFCATLCPSGSVFGLLPYYATTGAGEFGRAFTPGHGSTLWPILFHAAILIGFVWLAIRISGRVFCRYLCPMGAFLGLFHRLSLVRVEHAGGFCSDCGKCTRKCPMGINLSDPSFLIQSSCVRCGRCVKLCPSDARRWAFGFPGETVRNLTLDPESLFRLTLKGRLLRSLIGRKTLSPKKMAAYAARNTVFYERFYRGRDLKDFESLPLLTKRIVRDQSPYDLLSRKLAKKVVYYGETTGSTGSPTPSFFTEQEFHASTLLAYISPYFPALKAALKENRTALNGLAFGFTVAGMSFGDLLKNVGALVANTGSRSTLATPERIARGLERLKPSIVAATPVDFLSWMRILEEDYPDEAPDVKRSLRALMSTAELMAEERAARIAEHFDIFAVDIYACVEGFFSLPCPCGEKHILPAYHVEVFDQDLRRIGTQGTGRFAFTNLLKRSSPMVRYLLDDLVTISHTGCPYGFKQSIFPHGRWELTVRIGKENLNVRHFENLIFKHGLFGDWRVVIEEDRIEAVLERYAEPAGAAGAVADALEKRFGMSASVKLVPFGEITDYREPRRTKPILKIEDRRRGATQQFPKLL